MKKLRSALLSPILMLVVFASCSSNPEDINITDLEEPCDFIDAIGQCLDAIIEIAEGVDSPDKLSEDDKNRIEALSKKSEEISKKFAEKFDGDEGLDCPSAGEIMIKALKLDNLGIEDPI